MNRTIDLTYNEVSDNGEGKYLFGKSTQTVKKCIAKSAEKGYANAEYRLAECYCRGIGTSPNEKEALKWCNLAKEHGCTQTEFLQGEIYVMQGETKAAIDIYMSLLDKYEDAVMERLNSLAEKNISGAQTILGDLEAQKPQLKSIKAALEWYLSAIKNGNKSAIEKIISLTGASCLDDETYSKICMSLGNCYSNSKNILGYSDMKKAAEWYYKAAEKNCNEAFKILETWSYNGNVPAQYYYGMCWLCGKATSENEPEGAKWITKSAKSGFQDARYKLACCYENGYGVPKSHSQAMSWMKKCADDHDDDAARTLLEYWSNH